MRQRGVRRQPIDPASSCTFPKMPPCPGIEQRIAGAGIEAEHRLRGSAGRYVILAMPPMLTIARWWSARENRY